MATKTFEELKQMAIQIRDEKTNKQNTATRIGTQMLEHLNKLEQEYYDKITLDKRVTELNISELYKTQGIGGTNKYDLATAIAQAPTQYRSIVGLKITFVNNETSKPETWVYNGSTFTAAENWVRSNDNEKLEELEANMLPPIKGKNIFNYADKSSYINGKYINTSGTLISQTGWQTFILVVKAQTAYSINSGADWRIGFFQDDDFLSYTTDRYTKKFTTPENCNIVKISVTTSSLPDIKTLIVNEGDVIDENSKYWETYITPSLLDETKTELKESIQKVDGKTENIYTEIIDSTIDVLKIIKANTTLDKETGNFTSSSGKEAISIALNGQQNIRINGLNKSANIYYVLVKKNIPQLPAVTLKDTDVYINSEGYDEIRFGTSYNFKQFMGGVLVVHKDTVSNLLSRKVDKIYGKNIFDKSRKDNVPGWCNSGTLIEPQYGSINEEGKIEGYFTSYYMEVKPNTTYATTFLIGSNNSRVHLYSSDKVLSRTIKDNVSKTFTTGENEVLLRISAQNIIDTLSIEEGDTATENNPHEDFKLLTKLEYDDFVEKSNKLDQFLQEVKIVNHLADWKGLNMAGLGDSIIANSENPSGYSGGWLKIVGDYFGFDKRYNRGIGGTTIMDYNHELTVKVNPSGYAGTEEGVTDEMKVTCVQAMSSWSRIKAQFPESIKDTVDLVLFKGGTNDFGLSPSDIGDGLLPKWSIDNNYDAEWIADKTYNPEGGDFDSRLSFKGAIASTILKLQRWMPYARIVVVTQLSGRRETKENGMTDFCYDSNGKSPLDYANDAIRVAQMMSVNYIDVFSTCGINQFNSKLFLQDAVHPWGANTTQEGNIVRNGVSQLARSVIGELKNILPISRTYSDNNTYE